VKKSPLFLAFFAITGLASCDAICTSGELVVNNNSSETIYIYAEDELLGGVDSSDQNTFSVNSGEQLVEIESGIIAPTLEVRTIDIAGCGETVMDVD